MEYLEDRCVLSAVTMVKEITPGGTQFGPSSTAAKDNEFVTFNNELLFRVTNSQGQAELWGSDGTSDGTVRLGVFQNDIYHPFGISIVGSAAFFQATDGTNNGVWKTDGTVAGTTFIQGTQGAYDPVAVGSHLFYFLDGTDPGQFIPSHQLWTSDLSGGSKIELTSFGIVGDSIPVAMIAGNGVAYIDAEGALMSSDGTVSGTVNLNATVQGTSNGPNAWAFTGGRLFFQGTDSNDGNEPWTSNGTEQGTHRLADVNPGTADSNPQGFVAVGGSVYFSAEDGTHGRELWKSDLTAGDTSLVDDINPGSASSNPAWIVPGGNGIVFSATTAAYGTELWTSDGTPQGTTIVKDINPGSADSNPQWLASFNGKVYFSAVNLPFGAAGAVGDELWVTDGTASGTQLVADINPGQLDSFPRNLIIAGGTLFFTADDGTNGRQLWKLGGIGGGGNPLGDWQPVGPAPINGGQTAGGLPVSGRVTGVATDPIDANTIFIATAGGGVWRTTDALNPSPKWVPLTDYLSVGGDPIPMFYGAIAETRDKFNNEVLYAGTGEANNGVDNFAGIGLLISFDGGGTWEFSDNNGAFEGTTISKIAIDPRDPTGRTVYVAVSQTAGHIPVDPTTGQPISQATGVFKSTDGGSTWENVTAEAGLSTTATWSDVVVDPKTSDVIAAEGTSRGGSGNGVYQLVFQAGGPPKAILLPQTSGGGRTSLAIYDDGTTRELFAAIADPKSGGLAKMLRFVPYANLTYDLAAVDNLTTSVISTSNYLKTQGWYANTLAIAPGNPNCIYAAGTQTLQGHASLYDAAFGSGSPIESFDGGHTWYDVSANLSLFPKGPHTDTHAAAFDANGNLIEGDDGGVFMLKDATNSSNQHFATWASLNTNLQITTFTDITFEPTNPGIAYGGSQDNGTEEYSGSLGWTRVDDGDGGVVRISVDPSNNATYYYDEGDHLGLGSSTDGNTFNPVLTTTGTGANFLDGVNYHHYAQGSGSYSGQPKVDFYAPFQVDSSGAIYYGTDVLNMSTDHGKTWTVIGTPEAGGFNGATNSIDNSLGFPIDSIALTSDNKTIYVSAGGHIYVSFAAPGGGTNGYTWSDSSDPRVNVTMLNGLAADPTQPGTCYAVVSAYTKDTSGTVFKTTDFGVHWTDISGDLPVGPVNCISLSADGKTIYIGMDTGVYFSTNGGQNWTVLGGGLPNVQVVSIDVVNPNLIAVGTHGRGMWELNGTTGQAPIIVSANTTSFVAGHVPGSFQIVATALPNYSLTLGGDALPTGLSFDPSSGKIYGLPVAGTAGTYHVTITAQNASGTDTQNLSLTVVDPNALYVTAVYQDVLGRAADSGGLAYWTQLLDSGAAVSSVAQAIAHSAEYYGNFVIKPAYLQLLGRTADDAGVSFWVQKMQNGLTDQNLQAGFVASPEFYANAGGTNTAWIDAIYKLLLGRTADSAGEQYWNGQINSGATLLQVAQRIAGSPENNTQLINADYQHYLGRAADPGGLTFWLGQFAAGKTNEDVIAGFTGSDEYYADHTT